MLSTAGTMLREVLKLKPHESANTVMRKLGIKLIQRIGLIFLKVRLASWRLVRLSIQLSVAVGTTAAYC